MNLQEETDINKLKAITLDELDKISIAQQNVQLLRQRIAQLHDMSLVEQSKVAEKAGKTAK